MRNLIATFLILLCGSSFIAGKTVVFWQDGFPTVGSTAIPRTVLVQALNAGSPVFSDVEALNDPATLDNADLLVLPYGSALPVDGWTSIHNFLRGGGNLLVLGGQPLRVPVSYKDRKFIEGRPQDRWSREIGLRHTYEVPVPAGSTFAWKFGYSFLGKPQLRARRFFAIEGRLNGLGYMQNSEGVQVASPVIVADHSSADSDMPGARIVMLDFDPQPGYWESAEGTALIRDAANYARQGATSFWLEPLFSTLKPGEMPQIAVHVRSARHPRGQVKLDLRSGDATLDSIHVDTAATPSAPIFFHKPLEPGFYTVRGSYENAGQTLEFSQNGFWVEDEKMLSSGPVLGVQGDFLMRDGKPFFPFGTNYFTTEENGWDFSGPRNAWIWERDFDEMSRHGVTFVRTGVWMPFLRFVEPLTGEVTERFLRNLEAYLLSARKHNIIVNFTFYAFVPRVGSGAFGPPTASAPNPYIDPQAIRAEQEYIASVVERFKNVPWLCWDLINEPSFSNPARLWKGNTPNGDPAEVRSWHQWLHDKYRSVDDLATAWSVTPDQLKNFDSIPLLTPEDLAFTRYGNAKEVRAVDYNLFAQEKFSAWVQAMVDGIRKTGSKQLVDIGQDEGGVTNRVLNQFYASSGVAFTTNHTYWRDDALLWDSVVAKRRGVPNIVGETGYQPVWSVDGAWRYDEITGFPLLERKWALGFAAGNSGALQWDWAREADFGMKRSDGSAKSWQAMMRDMGQFAVMAAPWAKSIVQPQVAIVLPQSLQLSVSNGLALEAQQNCIRAMYQFARGSAYVVGEYQIEDLGDSKLILLPSPFGFTQKAWETILHKVESGATLLVSGVFDGDAHFHPTGRQNEVHLDYERAPLTIRHHNLIWPGGELHLTYGSDKITFLDRAVLPDDAMWAEEVVGKGRVLFSPLPIELNDNLQAIGDVYRYALKVAGVPSTYSTEIQDPGILICPTQFPEATLYVFTSETSSQNVTFIDNRSRKQFSTSLDAGRAALLLVGTDGRILASYNWRSSGAGRDVSNR